MASPTETPTPRVAPEIPVPVRLDEPADEASAPDAMVRRISAPVPDTRPASAADTPAAPFPLGAPTSLSSGDTDRNIFDAIADSRAVLARGVESMSDELASFARQSIDTTAHTAIQMLGAKTWADAVAVNTRFARTSFDHWLGSTAKVSELGLKLAIESSKPFVTKIGHAWSGARHGR
jgi:Phasin protein